MNKVYQVEVEISAVLQAQKTTRKSSILVGVADPSEITLEMLQREPAAAHNAVPRWISGKIRDQYRITKILSISGPIGLDGIENRQGGVI